MTWDTELNAAIAAAQEAGQALMRWFRTDMEVRDKGGKGPVTDADLEADRLLKAALTHQFPDDGWLSEETLDTPERLSHDRVWIIDPLDGTRDFADGRAEFSVSVGLSVGGVATVGAVFNPATDELMAGAIGHGVTLNGTSVEPTLTTDLAQARVILSRSEMGRDMYGPLAGQLTPEPVGSVAYKLALVAVGLADATFTPKPRNEWDLCGGVALLNATNGRATDGSGATYVFNRPDPLNLGVCGTNGPLHEACLAALTLCA
jgi:myo-inositol-1(or 4)-monophosphatase